jgi:hypothetical protein
MPSTWNWQALWKWLKENAEPLAAVGSIVTALGLIGTIIALVFAWRSLSATEHAVEANLMYQLQSDARKLSSQIYSSPEIRSYVLGTDDSAKVNDGTKAKAEGMLHELVRFYASIERLNSYEYVEREYWNNTKEDICDLMKFSNFRDFWQANVAAEGAQFRASFKTLGDDCET